MLTVKNTYLTSNLLEKTAQYTFGFSRRQHGDMRDPVRQTDFLTLTGIRKSLFLAKQVHGDRIVTPDDGHTGIIEADGILMERNSASAGRYAIGVVTADCVPIILADLHGNVVSVIHAGWKGTISGIVTKAVTRMTECGVRIENVFALIGPRIGGCCYSVPRERAMQFQSVFGLDPRVCYSSNENWFVDIGWINYHELSRAGVLPENLETLPMCTSCQVSDYYSYRKDTKESFGEQLAVISFA